MAIQKASTEKVKNQQQQHRRCRQKIKSDVCRALGWKTREWKIKKLNEKKNLVQEKSKDGWGQKLKEKKDARAFILRMI